MVPGRGVTPYLEITPKGARFDSSNRKENRESAMENRACSETSVSASFTYIYAELVSTKAQHSSDFVTNEEPKIHEYTPP